MKAEVHGVLNVWKRWGLTSHDCVAAVRRATGQRKAGHAGTLDPAAVGVLPICLGDATRVVEYLADASKVYCAEMILGITSESGDVEGGIAARREIADVQEAHLEALLPRFRGAVRQVPPMRSALKRAGVPLYRLAHRGEEVERAARVVHIFRLELVAWDPPAALLLVECSKGTYIRTLVEDLGEALGTGAYLQHLARPRVGPFTVETAAPLEQIEDAFRQGFGDQFLVAADEVLRDYPAVVVGEAAARGVALGRDVPRRPGSPPPTRPVARIYDTEGRFLAIGSFDAERNQWHPAKVFSHAGV